jgi:hypothetical protein
MKTSRLNKSWTRLLSMIRSNINNVTFRSKEEILMSRLQKKLGKSKEEVKKIISPSLMNVLTKVPFSCK